MDLSLYIVHLRYNDLGQLERHHPAHAEWCDRHSAGGTFLLIGPTTNYDSGALLARAGSRAELVAILEEDPFFRAGLVDYEIVEFKPRRGRLRRSPDNPLYLTAEQLAEALAVPTPFVSAAPTAG